MFINALLIMAGDQLHHPQTALHAFAVRTSALDLCLGGGIGQVFGVPDLGV
jgi:hypothetical protein